MAAERAWTKTKAIFKGRSHTSSGPQTNQTYEIAYRFTPENYIEVAVNLAKYGPVKYSNPKRFGQDWQIVQST